MTAPIAWLALYLALTRVPRVLCADNTAKGQQITSASQMRDKHWATWTCVLGWPVQGIWPPEADGTDINAVDRSHTQPFLLATADDFGRVRVFNYPCLPTVCAAVAAADVELGAQPNLQESAGKLVQPGSVDGTGHSSHVTNVRFNKDDSYMVTTGGNDRSVFQWRLNRKRF